MAVDLALEVGPPVVILEDIAYALPGRVVRVHSLAAIEFSIDKSTWSALTGANTVGAECGAGFVRCTTAATTVMVKVI